MIKFNEIVKDREYRERVIKYFRLPIRLSVSEEKFNSDLEFIKLTQPEKYAQIIKLTEADFNKVAQEQGKTELDLNADEDDRIDFTMENILEPLLEELENSEGWQEFTKVDYADKVIQDDDVVTSTHGFYVEDNHDKNFLSVDLKSANWQSLQSIIGIEESYEDMIVKYTDNQIPPVSKTFRTKITGILGARNIMHYNKFLLQENKPEILEVLLNETGINLHDRKITAFYADEFLIEISDEEKELLTGMDLDNLESDVYNNTGIQVHLTPFKLKWLGLNKACVKLYKNKEYEILNISKDILMIINKVSNDIIPNFEVDFEKVKLESDDDKERYVENIQLIVDDIQNSLGGNK